LTLLDIPKNAQELFGHCLVSRGWHFEQEKSSFLRRHNPVFGPNIWGAKSSEMVNAAAPEKAGDGMKQ
jgi:hypothetical protein